MIKPLNIVLCDDDPDEALIFQIALKNLTPSVHLTWVPGALQLIDYLFTTDPSPDFVFLDVKLDGITGIEVIPCVKKICTQAKIIMHSSSAAHVLAAFEAGANLYLLKGFSLPHFQSTLQKLLGKSDPIATFPVATFLLRA